MFRKSRLRQKMVFLLKKTRANGDTFHQNKVISAIFIIILIKMRKCVQESFKEHNF